MGNISDLEKQFKQQTEAETERLSQLGKSAFQQIEKDLHAQWQSNAKALENAMAQHNNRMIKSLENTRMRLNALLRFGLVGMITLIMLSVIFSAFWLTVGRSWIFSDPYQGLQIETCNYGKSMCAVGTHMNAQGQQETVRILIHRSQ